MLRRQITNQAPARSAARSVQLSDGDSTQHRRGFAAGRWTLILALAVAACGGGGTSEPAAAPCTPRTVHVDIFGDSVNYDAAPVIQAEADRRFGAGRVVVRNRAVPGSTSEQLVTGADGLNAPWPASVTGDVVLVNHGINDAYAPLGITLDRYRENLRKIAAAPGVVLQTPSPTLPAVYEVGPRAAAVREVAAEAKVPLADVQAYVLSLPNWAGHMPDGIHPNGTLHQMIAANSTLPAIAPLVLAKMGCLNG